MPPRGALAHVALPLLALAPLLCSVGCAQDTVPASPFACPGAASACKSFRHHPALSLDAWHHSGGSFTKREGRNWVEDDGGLKELFFEEARRDVDGREVLLHDHNRNLDILLGERMSYFVHGAHKQELFRGGWAPLAFDLPSHGCELRPNTHGTRWTHTQLGDVAPEGVAGAGAWLARAVGGELALLEALSSERELVLEWEGNRVSLADGRVAVLDSGSTTWVELPAGSWRPATRSHVPTLLPTQPSVVAPTTTRATSQTNLAIVTLSTPNIANYAQEAEINQHEYAQRHGYTLFVYRDSLVQWDQQGGAWHSIVTWNKIAAVMQHLEAFEWVLWVDSDAIFVDLDKPLEEILDMAPDKHLLVCEDPKDWLLNTGVMFFHRSQFTRDLLQRLWEMPKVTHSSGAEQNQLIKLLQHTDPQRTQWALFPECTFNCHPANYFDGVFVLHYMGMGSGAKEREIRKWNQKLGLSRG